MKDKQAMELQTPEVEGWGSGIAVGKEEEEEVETPEEEGRGSESGARKGEQGPEGRVGGGPGLMREGMYPEEGGR